MEELKTTVWIWGCTGIMLCMAFLFLIKQWEYRHPNLFTTKATENEKLQYKKIVLCAFNTILLYIMMLLMAISFASYDYPPLAIWLLCGVGTLYVITNFISIFRKK